MSNQAIASRMELLKLKSKLETTTRGHKLLKDKQTELMNFFVLLLKRYKECRIMTEKSILTSIKTYEKALIETELTSIKEETKKIKNTYSLKFSEDKKFGVLLPKMEYILISSKKEYNIYKTSIYYDHLIVNSMSLIEELICLANIESKINILIVEIKKSKRRVNAIENVVIANIKEEIKRINMKLADLERSNIIRTMKSKEIILDKEKK